MDAAKQVTSVATVKKDLLRSEKEYVYMLSILVDQYLCQLGESFHRPDFILDRRRAIFGNVEEVYQLHKKILKLLEQAKSTDDMCGVFLKMVSYLYIKSSFLKRISNFFHKYSFFFLVKSSFLPKYTLSHINWCG